MIYLLLAGIFVTLVLIYGQSKKRTGLTERLLQAEKFPAGDDLSPEIEELARQGKRLEAARAYRERTGCSVEHAIARIEPLLPRDSTGVQILIGIVGAVIAMAIAWHLSG